MNMNETIINARPRLVLLNTALLMSFIIGLLLPSGSVLAKEKDYEWDNWNALGEGYVGRRKVPKNFRKQLAERKSEHVDERLESALALREQLKNNKDKKALKALDKRIAKLEQKKKKSKKNKKTTQAVWLRNQEEGLFAVTVSELANEMGLNPANIIEMAKKEQLTLTHDNQGVAWLYYPDTDSIIYVAEEYNTFYTEQNAYRLSFGKTKLSQRMGISKKGKGPKNSPFKPFRDALIFEEEPDFFYSLWTVASEPDADYWFWDYLYGAYKDAINVDLEIPSPAIAGTAQIRVTLRGWTDLYNGDEHEVWAELNGVQIGSSVIWDAFDETVLTIDFDQSLLSADGNNQLVLHSDYADGTYPGQWLDKIEVDYLRMPVARDGQLWLHSVVGEQAVSGFNSDEIFVISNPSSFKPKIKRNISIYQQSDGSFSVSFKAKDGEDYLVSELSSIQTANISTDRASSLARRNNTADYLIIAHRQFTETAEALEAYRRSDYPKVKIAWLDDIYDEFNAGREDPFAVTRFLDYVKNHWRQPPSTVVVIGKGSIDHKNRMGYSDSFVPVVMIDTPWAITASDDRLINGDNNDGANVDDFAIGRIPVTSDVQGLAYIEKIKNYATQGTNEARFNAVLVADNPDVAGDFYANSDILAERLLNQLGFNNVTKYYHPLFPSISSQMEQSETWEGAGLISYDGHGSSTQVGDGYENFIQASKAMELTNDNLPVFVSLTCAAGDFTIPGTTSLAEALVLNPKGGAIAAYSPSGLSIDQDAQKIGHAFFDSAYLDNNRLGMAVKHAKVNVADSTMEFIRRMYTVIGDPAVEAR